MKYVTARVIDDVWFDILHILLTDGSILSQYF
jgi:hypothetical protein